MPIFRTSRRAVLRKAADGLYAAIVTQARRPGFYLHCGVPDTVDGRFDMIALHAVLVIRRLNAVPEAALAQALFDALFADMDQNLRQMGVGDIGVGHRVKAMARAFYGRAAAYEAGLLADDDSLGAALRRNLFREAAPDDAQVAAVSAYVRAEARALDGVGAEVLTTGALAFGTPPGAALEGAP